MSDLPPPFLEYSDEASRAGSHLVMTLVCWAIIAGLVVFVMRVNVLATQVRTARAQTSAKATPNISLEFTARVAVFHTAHPTPTAAATDDPKALNKKLDSYRKMAAGPGDQLDVVILSREEAGRARALEMLHKVREDLPRDGALHADADILANLYSKPIALVPEADRDRLSGDLGWFGRLAVSQELPPDSAQRQEMISSATRSVIVLGLGGILVLLAFLSGIALLVVMIVLFSNGKLKWNYLPLHVPPSGRPVFLESFTLWFVSYLCMSWIASRVGITSVLIHELLLFFLTAAVAVWPLARGVSWPQLRQALGWHTGRGVLIEMVMGAWGYVAGLPLIAVAFGITALLLKWGHTQATHPIVEDFTGGMPLSRIFVLLMLAAVLAPILEETIFRGALYTHMRRRWRPWIAAGVVALVFAAIHPQGWAAIPVLGSIALILAMLREWRGSLIASITAHAINNGFMVLFLGLALH